MRVLLSHLLLDAKGPLQITLSFSYNIIDSSLSSYPSNIDCSLSYLFPLEHLFLVYKMNQNHLELS